MELYCTRPGCPRPRNVYPDLDDRNTLVTIQQKYCTACGMPLILVGRYLPQRLLGQGGFGAAFLARDRYTPGLRTCVVKLFQPAGDLNPAQLKIAQGLFEREAEVLEDLGNKHPQIPDLFAFFPLTVPSANGSGQEEYFYLVQEFIDGETLEDELAQRGAFSQEEVRHILTEILKILQFVHENGSIHRDIKPSNIMRSRDGTIYLLDFGAVKQATKGGGGQRQASTGIYSQGYAPPEQMAGSQVYPSTDLYALAVTCISLLTGKDPLELYDGYHNTWQWRSHVPQLDPSLAAVLDRMLQPVPNDRFASAAEVLAVLKRQQSSVLPRSSPPPRSSSPAPVPPAAPPPPVAAAAPSPPVAPISPPAPIAPAPPAPAPVPVRSAPPPVAQRPPASSGTSSTISGLWSVDFLGKAALMGAVCGVLAVMISSLAPANLALTPIGLGFWLALLAEMTLIQFPWFFNFSFLGVLLLVALALLFLIAPIPAIVGVIPFLLPASPLWVNFLLLLSILALLGTAIAVFYRLFFSWLARLFP